MFKDIKVEEIVVYLMLIVVGYYIAKMFSRSCNGFSVGGPQCQTLTTFGYRCNNGRELDPAKKSNLATSKNYNTNCCQ